MAFLPHSECVLRRVLILNQSRLVRVHWILCDHFAAEIGTTFAVLYGQDRDLCPKLDAHRCG